MYGSVNILTVDVSLLCFTQTFGQSLTDNFGTQGEVTDCCCMIIVPLRVELPHQVTHPCFQFFKNSPPFQTKC